MADRLTLSVRTPTGTSLEAAVDFVILRTVEGDMGILPGHEPCAVALESGRLRAFVEGREQTVLQVLGGFAWVRGNRVQVLSAVAERPENLAAALRRMEQERAESKRQDHVSEVEVQRTEMALRRNLVRDFGAHSLLAELEQAKSAGTQDEEE